MQRQASSPVGSPRDDAFDVMKGLGILAVIVGHLAPFGQRFIFSWHMPLFFLLSGYFFRPQEPAVAVRNDARRLLLPYLLTSLAVIAVYGVISLVHGYDAVSRWVVAALWGSGSSLHTSRYWADVPPIGAIWFLWGLFWCKNVFNLLQRLSWLPLAVVSLLLSVAAICLDVFWVNLPFAILPGVSALVFFMVGHMTRRYGWLAQPHRAFATVGFVVWCAAIAFSDMSMVRCYYDNYLLSVVGACGATYLIYLLSRLIAAHRGRWLATATWLGRNSLTLLCLHLFDMAYPTRSLLHLASGMKIPYDLLLCVVGTLLLAKIPLTRRVFNIR